MKLSIEAINIRSGGGINHLTNLLLNYSPDQYKFNEIHIWTNRKAADSLPKFKWVYIHVPFWANYWLPIRALFQKYILSYSINNTSSDLLFIPSGTISFKGCLSTVLMSQNMLPFESHEAKLFGELSTTRIKMYILRIIQKSSFSKSDGLIFLTEYAKNKVTKHLDNIPEHICTIPHGIEQRFFHLPRRQININNYSYEKPFKFIYVSVTMPYKHQIEVADAFRKLRLQGLPIEITFIGQSIGRYGKKLISHIRSIDPDSKYIKFAGHIPFDTLQKNYSDADAFLFASSCENLPNILIEAMASGLPIACSLRGPMPEVLGSAGAYFDPYNTNSIYECLLNFINDTKLRATLAQESYALAKNYSWSNSAKYTFNFFSKIIENNKV